MPMFVERRARPRVALRTRLVVTVLACDADPALVGHRFTCFTRDVSVGGLQFSSYCNLPAGAKLEIQFVGKELDAEFKHVGKVVWAADRGHKCFWAGVLLTDTPRETLVAWKRRVVDLVAAGNKPAARRRRGAPG